MQKKWEFGKEYSSNDIPSNCGQTPIGAIRVFAFTGVRSRLRSGQVTSNAFLFARRSLENTKLIYEYMSIFKNLRHNFRHGHDAYDD